MPIKEIQKSDVKFPLLETGIFLHMKAEYLQADKYKYRLGI